MTRRTRKFIGTVAMLIFVGVYAATAMVLAEARPIREAPGYLQAIYYGIIGLAWVLPLMPLIAWMERPDPEPGP